jgi:hypothetical protein
MSYSIEHKVSGNIHPAIKYMMDSDCIVGSYRVINTIRASYFNSYSLALPRFYIKQTATLRHVVKREYGFFEFCNYFFSRLGKSGICNVVVNFLQFFLSFLRQQPESSFDVSVFNARKSFFCRTKTSFLKIFEAGFKCLVYILSAHL